MARNSLAATTIGSCALFGGGIYNYSESSTVDAYDSSLTRTTATDLSIARGGLAATTIGKYALFGGGSYDDGDIDNTIYYSTVDAYCVWE